MQTYFFERPNGEPFACEAEEASTAVKKFKYLGQSDGLTYKKILQAEAPKIRALKSEPTRTERRIDALTSKLAELEESTGKTAEKKIEKLEKELEILLEKWDKQKEKMNIALDIINRKGFEAELTIARTNRMPPPDMSVYYPGGNKERLAPFMQGRT